MKGRRWNLCPCPPPVRAVFTAPPLRAMMVTVCPDRPAFTGRERSE